MEWLGRRGILAGEDQTEVHGPPARSPFPGKQHSGNRNPGNQKSVKQPRSSGTARLGAMFPRCGNDRCGSGPVRLWRSRRVPVFEGRWACSAECLRAMVEAAIGRERHGDGPGAEWTHRIPLGLMLLEQGRISEEQLRQASQSRQSAVDADGEAMGLEEWLLNSGLLTEAALTRAISAQWNCPVFSLPENRTVEMASPIPPFLLEALGALPVSVSGGKLLYLAFSERIDRSLTYAVEHVTGLQVAAGIARESELRREQVRVLSAGAPRTRFLEGEDLRALAGAMAAWIEEERPVEARLARVHEIWWLRIWRKEARGAALPAGEAVEDLLATVGRQELGAGGRELQENPIPPISKPEGSGLSCRE